MGFRIDSESILYSKESILLTILWPKTVILNQFGIVGNRNRLSPSRHHISGRPHALAFAFIV